MHTALAEFMVLAKCNTGGEKYFVQKMACHDWDCTTNLSKVGFKPTTPGVIATLMQHRSAILTQKCLFTRMDRSFELHENAQRKEKKNVLFTDTSFYDNTT